ncbi:thiamine phosphate synthase [Olivibacter ginsenosidimutans]|uniref:Thiamine-phosphate synthase n=1 Tax=Olivibacter ginsenosidimutans TaxID=1176537 RepID=A0ABP9AMC7_9SPHI
MESRLKKIERLHYITHPVAAYTLAEQTRLVTEAGGKWIQFRMKQTNAHTFKGQAEQALQVAREGGATFIINDDVLAAKMLDADGVHLGKEDLNPLEARKLLGDEKIIGCTANTLADILYLQTLPIDYIGLGPFRFTSTKQKLSPILGLSGYKTIIQALQRQEIAIPIIAIGGIRLTDIVHLFEIGVYGIAASGVILNTSDPKASCTALLTQIKQSQ